MRITELFTAQSIALDEAQQDRSQIIDRLVELQATHGNIRDKEAYKKGLYEREDEGSTYVDNGITVPHAKCDCVTRPSLAALRLKTPVQYNAEDDGKTDLLFAIAAPKNGSLHVDMLARMMQMLMNEDFVEKLRTAKTPEDFLAAIDRIVGGLERKNKIITPEEKRTIAYHEAGHATVSWILENASPLIKVTIIPRGKALGAAWYLPEERQITTREQLMAEMASTLGGRVSEQLTFGKVSTGALNDLERVTKMAYAMVAYYGMSDKVGTLSYYDSTGQSDMTFTKPYSEQTAQEIDTETKRIIDEAYAMARKVLTEHADGLKQLAELLLAREVVFTEDVERIFGKRKKDILRERAEAEAAQEHKQAEKLRRKERAEEKAEEKDNDKAATDAADGKEPKAGSTIITVSLDPEIKDGAGKEAKPEEKPEEKSQDRSDAADKLS